MTKTKYQLALRILNFHRPCMNGSPNRAGHIASGLPRKNGEEIGIGKLDI